MHESRVITFLLLSIFLVPACGAEGSFYAPPSRTTGPNASVSGTDLQIYLEGSDQPLISLQGHRGDTLHLETRGSSPGFSTQWFTSNVARGKFVRPGVLRLTGIGSFEVRVFVGPWRAVLPVEVLPDNPPPQPDPTSPSSPEPDETPMATDSPEPTEAPQPPPVPSDPFMDEVVSFNPGPAAGFGSDKFPEIVLGPPQGSGAGAGSFHVLSLGIGGEIILKSDTPLLDEAGIDFIVFENPFYAGGNPKAPFAEPGQVSVSQDGLSYFHYPCDSTNSADLYPGCAGVHPVYANPLTNTIDPTDPDVAGGDGYDLEDIGLAWAQYVRIRDKSSAGGGISAGFDLDAISIVHQ